MHEPRHPNKLNKPAIHTPLDPDKAREENRTNSLKVLNSLWLIEKDEFKDRIRDVRNFGYKIPISLFLVASFIVSVIAEFSDTHGHKSMPQVISIGALYPLGALLAIIVLALSVLITKWGYMYYLHKKYSKETRMLLGEAYFRVRFKEDPPGIIWGFSIILAISMWYITTQLFLIIPYVGEFIYWATY